MSKSSSENSESDEQETGPGNLHDISAQEIDLNDQGKLRMHTNDNTMTLIRFGSCFRLKIIRNYECLAPLSVLLSILFGTYMAHFLSKCHDDVTGAHDLSVYAFVVIFFVAFYTALIDPGYVKRDVYENEDTNREIVCKKCNSYKDEGVAHCYTCERCVKGYDHHCGVLGNCVGKNNYYGFKLFIVSLVIGFLIIAINFILTFCICW